MREYLDETARRELEEETGVKGLVMEQIATYGDYDRDPRTRVITTAYMAVVPENAVKVQAGDDAADAVWCEVNLQGVSTEERENDLKFYGGAVSDPEKQMELKRKANRKVAEMVQKEASATLKKVLYELSNQMKNSYARSDV